MKLDEYWLVYCSDGVTRVSSYENGKDGLLPKNLVREVSPELDAAHAECEKALKTISQIEQRKRMIPEIEILAEQALAALKKARDG